MFLLYAPAMLMQKIFSNIFTSGIINGFSQLITIPFLSYFNTKVSRRNGLIFMFGPTTLFTLIQFALNPTGCINCTSSLVSTLILVSFFIARFFINLDSNFFVNVINESFPAQIRSVSYCAVVGIGRLSTLIIPYVPKISQDLQLSYNFIFGVVGVMGLIASYFIKETLGIPPPEMIEELRNIDNLEVKREEPTALKEKKRLDIAKRETG